MVRCTSSNRAMLVRNCYLEISNYLNKDIFQYKDSVDELMEKLLLLKNVDFELSTNGRMVTEMLDHQDKPDELTKDN